ncbi:MAG TPA: deoxyribodipyrimidine photo-lyase [Arenimonas sp.]|nr:deoxyribodipyrimidine photo-lyase [Arenimonas sp.]
MARALVWFRRDLRLADNPALQAALAAGYAPVPVYLHAPDEEGEWAPGAATRVWLARSLAALDADLRARGSRLLIRCGPSLAALSLLIEETQAEAVFWNRLYEPAVIARDAAVKSALRQRGLRVESHNAALLVEPWTVATGSGDPYRVFTPFWRNAGRVLESLPLSQPAPSRLPAMSFAGMVPDELGLGPAPCEPDWDAGFWEHWQPGEAGAWELLEAFLDSAIRGYDQQRNLPDRAGTSRLSPHLHFGEIAPWRIVQAVQGSGLGQAHAADLKQYFAELGWREFAHHLLYHFPHTPQADFNPRFAGFPWCDADVDVLHAWQCGRTGVPLVDAGMRELWQTGWMHNRVRMVVASFLCKNLRIHWRHGARWFWDTLVDADLANNSLGWQWSAGTGADAAPYFRVFNPATQATRFDPQGRYLRRWLPELAALPDRALAAPWEHTELLRRLAPEYPQQPMVNLRESREAALDAYAASRA